jgi:hypothetical protein
LDRHTTISQRPARSVPAGVLNAEVEEGRISDCSLGFDPIELLDMDTMLQSL